MILVYDTIPRGIVRPQAILAMAWGVASNSFVECSTVATFCTVNHCTLKVGLGRYFILATLLTIPIVGGIMFLLYLLIFKISM
jgi:hypothetical protein